MSTTNQTNETNGMITDQEFTAIENNFLTAAKMKFITEPTPGNEIQTKIGKDGRKYKYVKGSYIKKVLNLMFGFRWNFEVIEKEYYPEFKQVVITGKLTVFGGIIKTQFGGSDVENNNIADAYKAAATDALKKCAAEFGIASDVYGGDDIKSAPLTDVEKLEKVKELYKSALENTQIKIASSDKAFLDRIIEEKELTSYDKAIDQLQKKLSKFN